MVLCTECKRYFTAEHDGKKWHLCDMDCYVDSISVYDIDNKDTECDWFEHVDRNDTKN